MKDIKSKLSKIQKEVEEDIRSLLELEKSVLSEISVYNDSIKDQFSDNIKRSKRIRSYLSKRLADIDQMEMQLKEYTSK
jgi:hypothetical protein